MSIRRSITIARCAAVLAFALTGAPGMTDTVWHDATTFDIEGRGWSDVASAYHRFPAHARGVVPDHVWGLSTDSAGIAVRFQTNAPRIHVRWTLSNATLAMPHMPATGVSGVDLYAREADGRWRFVHNGRPAARDANEMEAVIGGAATVPMREYLLYLPLYNGTASLSIGTPAGAVIERAAPRPADRMHPVVVYGTSIAQGGCASRPGLAWTAILGRMLDRPVVNLGFSGSGRMEPEVAGVIAELDPAAFVIDCLWNLSGEEAQVIETRVKGLVRAIRARHPHTPIVFVGQSHIQLEAHPTPATRAQERAVRALRAEHVSGLILLSGARMMGSDAEATVDGVHPNDIGMLRQAEVLAPALRRLLR